jgi:Tfp pilus assembly protein PilN
MINLNFTSPSQKAANQFQKNYHLVQSLVVTSILALLIIVVALFASQKILESKLDKLTNDTLTLKEQTENDNSLNLGETVQGFNTLVSNVAGIQSEYAKWSYILLEVSECITDGIILTSFDIQKGSNTFQFTGNAATRDSLLSFKTNLDASPYFENVESPISNLLSKENISFILTGKVVLNPTIDGIQE